MRIHNTQTSNVVLGVHIIVTLYIYDQKCI